MTNPTAEPDNPAAYALARHIADHPLGTVQAAFRYLNAGLAIELREDSTAPAGVAPATGQAADVWVACSPEWLAANPGQCGTAQRIPGPEGISHLHPAAGRAPAEVCICGHTEQQHFEDVCLTEITGCDCGDFLNAEAASEEITRLQQIVRQREDAVDIDTLARLMCDADVFVNDGDYPGWDDLSTTPGLGKDEVRKAARYLMRRLHITLHKPAAAQQPKEADGARVVAYFHPDVPNVLLCRVHGNRADLDVMPLASENLPNGGVCTECGVDVLIPQQPKDAR